VTDATGDQALRELPSPGKSGSVFFLSHDDRFIIKTMRKVWPLSFVRAYIANAWSCPLFGLLNLGLSKVTGALVSDPHMNMLNEVAFSEVAFSDTHA